jgi:hypothetical protein
MLPRDAFFAAKENVDAGQAVGRICAEQITPYPPGIPVIIPGERITAELLDYLRSGLAAGMQLPDPADPALAPSVSSPRPTAVGEGRSPLWPLSVRPPAAVAGGALLDDWSGSSARVRPIDAGQFESAGAG